MSDDEAVQLVMLPGFSTSEVVTDLSGRGVGTDAVKSGQAGEPAGRGLPRRSVERGPGAAPDLGRPGVGVPRGIPGAEQEVR